MLRGFAASPIYLVMRADCPYKVESVMQTTHNTLPVWQGVVGLSLLLPSRGTTVIWMRRWYAILQPALVT